jgi:hypothetical protein
VVYASVVVLNISMNVTQLQQPPPQSGLPRSTLEAEDTTPDVCGLPIAWNRYTHTPSQFLSIRLVNKRTRAKLSPEPLDLTPIPNKGQLFVVASTLGWFVAIIRSSTGLGMFSLPRLNRSQHVYSSSCCLTARGPSIPPILSGSKLGQCFSAAAEDSLLFCYPKSSRFRAQ